MPIEIGSRCRHRALEGQIKFPYPLPILGDQVERIGDKLSVPFPEPEGLDQSVQVGLRGASGEWCERCIGNVQSFLRSFENRGGLQAGGTPM